MLRRSLLKGATAITLSGAGHCLAPVLDSTPPTLAGAPVNILSVYFHGLFAFVFDHTNKRIEAHPPIVALPKHTHLYKAGSLKGADCSSLVDLVKGDDYSLQIGFNAAAVLAGLLRFCCLVRGEKLSDGHPNRLHDAILFYNTTSNSFIETGSPRKQN